MPPDVDQNTHLVKEELQVSSKVIGQLPEWDLFCGLSWARAPCPYSSLSLKNNSSKVIIISQEMMYTS